LANQYKSENLGQGFPDWESPDFVKDAMCNSIRNNFNQYCRSRGDIALVTALSKHYSPLIGRDLNPLTEITISVGATEGLFAIMQAYLNPGDEVVTFEPAFDMSVSSFWLPLTILFPLLLPPPPPLRCQLPSSGSNGRRSDQICSPAVG
jgi:aspartate/methionine/tyrosine aminotransferase